jgi:Zn-dependent protease
MRTGLRLGKVLGIPIEIHWSLLAVATLLTANLAVRVLPHTDLRSRLVAALVGVTLFFGSILAHELGHALVALGHRVGVSGISLWLLGGMAQLDRMVPTAQAELRIAAAGPAVSGLVAVFFAASSYIAHQMGAGPLVVTVGVWLAWLNLTLALFNLLPAAPLDGGRILAAVLWRRLGDGERARVVAGRCGLILAVLLALGGLFQLLIPGQIEGWLTVGIGLFVFSAARGEIRGAVVRRRLQRTPVSALAVLHPPSVPDSTSVLALTRWVGAGGLNTAYPVVRWDRDPVGYVVPGALATLPAAQQSWTRLSQVMAGSQSVDRVDAADSANAVLDRWGEDRNRIGVVSRGNDPTPVATITFAQIAPLLTWPDLWGRDRTPRQLDPGRPG